jgi:exodeoxyribonuclease V alpha subunit
MDELTGSVERITYYNPENGYSVLRPEGTQHLSGVSRDGLVTVVGNLPELAPGEHLRTSTSSVQACAGAGTTTPSTANSSKPSSASRP